MWPGGSPTAVNGAAGLTIVALIIAALYVGRDLLILLALAGILSFISWRGLADPARSPAEPYLSRIHQIHDPAR
jgi:hypothetical protein